MKWFFVGLICICLLGLLCDLTIADDVLGVEGDKLFGIGSALYVLVYIAVHAALADRDASLKKQTGVRNVLR